MRCEDVCYAIPDVLTATACQAIVAEATRAGFAPTGADYPPSYRDNDRLVRDDPGLAARLFGDLRDRLPARLVDREGATWTLVGLNERFRLCRYQGGQGFRIHRDGAHAPSADTRSLLTLQVYLDDQAGFEGGRTRFYAAREGTMTTAFAPVRGQAIVFDHQLWHDGEPVTAGTKHVIRTDVIYARQAPAAAAEDDGTATTLAGHAGYVLAAVALDESAPGPLAGGFATASRDRTVRLWRGDGTCVRVLAGHGASVVTLAAAAGALWSGSRDHAVRRWDLASGASTEAYRHAGAVLALASLPDGRLASGAGDATIALHDPADGARATLVGHAGWVWSLAALGEWLVSGSEDGTLRVWHPGDRASVALLAPGRGPVHALAAGGDGTVAAGFADGWIVRYVFDASGGRLVERQAFQAHAGEVYALAALADGRLASGGEDDVARVWDGCDRVGELAHGGFVRAVVGIGGDGVVTGAYDGLVRVWRAG